MSWKGKNTVCPTCGAKTVEHKHGLANGIRTALAKLYETHGCDFVSLSEVGLTRSQWDNFQKLRYWDLVEKHPSGEKSGQWRVTDHGERWLTGRVTVPRNVWTYRGERTRFDGQLVGISVPLSTHYKRRPEYAADALPFGGSR